CLCRTEPRHTRCRTGPALVRHAELQSWRPVLARSPGRAGPVLHLSCNRPEESAGADRPIYSSHALTQNRLFLQHSICFTQTTSAVSKRSAPWNAKHETHEVVLSSLHRAAAGAHVARRQRASDSDRTGQ